MTIKMKSAAVLAVLSLRLALGEVLQLTEANYVDMTEGKTVFLKMFAPWVSEVKVVDVVRW